MRNLQTRDVFAMARLIKEINAKESFLEAYTSTKEDNESAEERGINLLFSLVYSASSTKAENLFYELLADVMETKPEEIKNQSIDKTMENLKAIAESNDIKNFFSIVHQLMPKLS